MKFLRVEVENWRPFRGTSAMDIASSNDRSITLIFGKNGGGKTAMLTAIYWCLYGEMDLEEGKGKQFLVNDYAVQDADTTKSDPVRATVTLYASGTIPTPTTLYRIQRTQSAYQTRGTRYESPGGLSVDRITPHSGYRAGDDVVAACDHPMSHVEHFEGTSATPIVESLLPQGLAKYFFYPGETLSFPFKNDRRSTELLEKFLREISGSNKFAPYEKLVQTARSVLDAKSKAHADANSLTKKLQQQIEDLEAQQIAKEALHKAASAELSAAELNLEAVLKQLDSLDALKDVLTEAEAKRAAEREAESAVDRAEQDLSDALRDCYLHVAAPLFDAVVAVFVQRDYPNDISNALVKQMRESMVCICGRELSDEMLRNLEPLSPTDDTIVNRMFTLTSHAASLRTDDADRAAVDSARVSLNNSLDQHEKAVTARAAADANLEAAGAEQFADVSRDNLVAERTSCLEDIREYSGNIEGHSANIKSIKEAIARLQDEKTSAAPKTDRAIHHAASFARDMEELLEEIKSRQADVAREQLTSQINDNYKIYKTNLTAEVDPEFRVKVFDNSRDERIEKPVGDLSGSETALLTYAFAAAAAKLLPQYQTLDKLLTTRPVFGDVENIPLVVDAPFASLGREYRRRVMDLMTSGFSQVVMFTESSDTEVLEGAVDKIGEQYLVHFEGQLEDDVEDTFDWRGNTYTYASPNNLIVRSTLRRIEESQ